VDALPVSFKKVSSQKQSLEILAQIVAQASASEHVRRVANALVADCPARNDECELETIFKAVKHGDSRIKGLERGVRYVADPRYADFFTTPQRMLAECEAGVCAEDCDGQAALVASLCAALGFRVGLRAWGKNANLNEYEHVYAVVEMPKKGGDDTEVWGMDTTVPQSDLGWEPPQGRVMTAWCKEDY
jgi:hypothetical protein